jgi:hypothetical protein
LVVSRVGFSPPLDQGHLIKHSICTFESNAFD